MGIGNILVLCQLTSYVLASILSLFVFAAMAANKIGDFAGYCLLFATGHYNKTSEQYLVDSWGPTAGCNFAITIGVFVLVISVLQIIRLSVHVFYDTDSSFIGAFGTFVGNMIVALMLFASAVNVTEGYSAWCRPISKFTSCSLAPYEVHAWTVTVSKYHIDPTNYAIQLGMVQFGLWSELFMWIFLCIFSVVKLIKYNQQESIVRSLNREKDRFLGHYSQPDF